MATGAVLVPDYGDVVGSKKRMVKQLRLQREKAAVDELKMMVEVGCVHCPASGGGRGGTTVSSPGDIEPAQFRAES